MRRHSLHFSFENQAIVSFTSINEGGQSENDLKMELKMELRISGPAGRPAGRAEVPPYPMAGEIFPSTTSSYAGPDPDLTLLT